MKLKEFGPPGGRASKILLCRSATGVPDRCEQSQRWLKFGVEKDSVKYLLHLSQMSQATILIKAKGLKTSPS